MVTKLKYSEEGFTIVADDTADLLKVFDHVMEGPQVVEVRNNVTVDGPSPWASPVLYEAGELPVATGTIIQTDQIDGKKYSIEAVDAPVSVGPLIGEELITYEATCGSVQPIEPIVTTTDVVVKRKKAKAAPLADGWITWNPALYEGSGGPAGIEEGTEMTVRLRGGTEMNIEMGTLDSYWNNDDCEFDIIAYKVEA